MSSQSLSQAQKSSVPSQSSGDADFTPGSESFQSQGSSVPSQGQLLCNWITTLFNYCRGVFRKAAVHLLFLGKSDRASHTVPHPRMHPASPRGLHACVIPGRHGQGDHGLLGWAQERLVQQSSLH
jgi:hypothetical protein